MVYSVYGEMMLLVIFRDGCDNVLDPNQLINVIVDRIPVPKSAKAPTIYMKPEEKFYLKKLYYHGVYVIVDFNKEEYVYKIRSGHKWRLIRARRILGM